MKERDYVLATSLARIMAASDCLMSVLPHPKMLGIPKKELREVTRRLAEWQDMLFDKIRKERQQ